MSIDLSALDSLDDAKSTGEPLSVAIDLIDEDPGQPRHEFSAESMEEITASIKDRGVKSPVSLRPSPNGDGRYMLNFGARRLRASKAAGLTEIPAFIDEAHDDYDQVIENEQRENLTPMELALFIKRKIDGGEKKNVIAKKLGKPADVVTRHLSLIDMPPCIEEIYSSGKSRSPWTLYAVRQLHDKHPAAVEAWFADVDEVTRSGVDALARELKGQGSSKREGTPSPKIVHAQETGAGTANNGDGATAAAGDGKPDAEGGKRPVRTDGSTGNVGKGAEDPGVDTGEMTSWPKGKAVSDPNLMKKPLLLVDYDGRTAALLLNRRPSADGLVWIRYEDNGGDESVAVDTLKFNRLMEE